MPNRSVKRKSVVDMLAKVPVNRGSLLTSIENLLKTIESSESAVMIPTLLRDKCEFDAWELLFVAKILKASILGHVDLVEFYMNHIGLNSGQFTASQTSNATTPTATTPASGQTHPSATNQPVVDLGAMAGRNGTSPILSPTGSTPSTGIAQQLSQQPAPLASPISYSPAGSISAVIPLQATTTASTNGANTLSTTTTTTTTTTTKGQVLSSSTSASSTSWSTANHSPGASTGVSASSSSASVSSHNGAGNGALDAANSPMTTESVTGLPLVGELPVSVSGTELLLAARPPVYTRQAQPPSLLQLTTNNNHINSVAAAGFTNGAIEQLTSQLSSLQTNGCLANKPPLASPTSAASANQASGPSQVQAPSNSGPLNGALSISTAAANQQSVVVVGPGSGAGTTSAAVTPTSQPHHHELRSSRSAGCLFRLNSGASSPRTPTTPYPQAETLAMGQANGLPGDPSAPVKLLLQIEQLKLSISHVTSLLESVVELYKKSIDNMA